jgi:hydrogenase expression/formation protein HypD
MAPPDTPAPSSPRPNAPEPLNRLSQADPDLVRRLTAEIRDAAAAIGRPVRLMEVCGTHTMAIFRAGLRSLIPESVRLLSGPGCPVCVTPMGYVDAAVELSRRPDVTVTTFGDMVRVPGTESSLERERGRGADVRIVYSPLDALRVAQERPDRKVVFLGVGFETTAPATAATLLEARRRGVGNFLLFSAHKVVPPALRALLASEAVALDGFILPGHVSVVLGAAPYEFIPNEYRRAAVIAGFEPLDILQAILMLIRQIAEGKPRVEIQYSRVVRPEGNLAARRAMAACFAPCDTEWRGLGRLPGSGLRVCEELGEHDAVRVLDLKVPEGREPVGCRCGEVLRGLIEPEECPLFGARCTTAAPVGACMVSSEGTCAAHFNFRTSEGGR